MLLGLGTSGLPWGQPGCQELGCGVSSASAKAKHASQPKPPKQKSPISCPCPPQDPALPPRHAGICGATPAGGQLSTHSTHGHRLLPVPGPWGTGWVGDVCAWGGPWDGGGDAAASGGRGKPAQLHGEGAWGDFCPQTHTTAPEGPDPLPTGGGIPQTALPPPVTAASPPPLLGPGKGGAACAELRQRGNRAEALLLTVGVGRMLLKCLFFLRRAILYCGERGTAVALAWTGWPHGSWSQPGFARGWVQSMDHPQTPRAAPPHLGPAPKPPTMADGMLSWPGPRAALDPRWQNNGQTEGPHVARTSPGHRKDTLPVPAGQRSHFPGLIALVLPWRGVRAPREAAALSLASSGKADKRRL